MPGIVGIISQRPSDECQHLVKSMVGAMERETFYDSGTHSIPKLGIYAGWVAHKDSFADGQPFFNEQRDIAVLFSGECYIDPETRAELKQTGHDLGETAGSWLVHFYEEQGDEFFEKLNGLFSGLLIDERKNKAFLFNDRYGLERIYWHETEDATYFASEAKALLRVLPRLREFDDQGVAEFLTYGCILGYRTLFKGIQLLPGASVLSIEHGKCRRRRYFSPEIWEAQSPLLAETFESEFQATFKRILPRYFQSNSKIGISLTGGLDTRMIMACRPKTDENPVCYTFSGEDGLTLDDRLAARVAEACGLEHRLVRIGSDFLSAFPLHVDRTVYATDGCCGATGAHEIYLNAQARQLAPVRLTGNFGSEVLRGVSTFKPIGLSDDLLTPEIGRVASGSVKALSNSREHAVTSAAFREIPWNLFGSVAACRSQVTFRTPYLDNELVALAYRAPEHLRNSSLPASRLVRANSTVLNEIPTDRGFVGDNSGPGFLIRRFFAEATFKIDYYNSEGLPRLLSQLDSMVRRVSLNLGILGMHKYLPYSHWFRKELAPILLERVSTERVRQAPWWKKGAPEAHARAHVSRRGHYMRELNAILTLEAIDRLFFSHPQQECLPGGTIALQPDWGRSLHKAAALRKRVVS
jgi:asparagine synthase (glutamine-hydrolysing)